MTIKYAEIVISRNIQEESWLSYFKNLLGEENRTTENDTIIISFDDGTITDTKSAFVDKQFKFGCKSYRTIYPAYFKNPRKDFMLFLKEASFKDGNLRMDFKDIFKDDPKYTTVKKTPSIYNAIYHSILTNKELFSIIKKGNHHCYLLAYDDDYFDKSDIIYFIHRLFTDTFIYSYDKF